MSTNTHEQPNLIIEFSKGDYGHALRCHESAKQWALETGLAFRSDVYGRILPPDHPGSPHYDKVAPSDLMDDPNWTIRVELFASNEDVLRQLLALTLPDNSALSGGENK